MTVDTLDSFTVYQLWLLVEIVPSGNMFAMEFGELFEVVTLLDVQSFGDEKVLCESRCLGKVSA